MCSLMGPHAQKDSTSNFMLSCHYLIFLITFEQTYPHFCSALEPTSYRVSSRWNFFCGDCTFTKLIKLYFKKKETLLFSTGMWFNAVVLASGEEQKDSAILMHVSIPLPPKLPSHPGCLVILSRVLKWVVLLF